MNFSELININPIISSFFGLSILIINYFFSYVISTRFKLIDNNKLNFVFFNISFYFLISSILLFLILFKIEIILIRYLFYLIFLTQIIFLFFNYKNIFKKNSEFFNKLDYFFLLVLFLYTFSQISDADSLDYHLGGVLEIIRSNNFESRIDEWYFFRLIGLGEMINLYGLFFYSLNFGQIFQVLAVSNLILILSLFNKNNKINYLIILSFPIIISLMLSAKHMPLITNCYLVIFSLIILKIKLLPKTFFAILILILAPIGFKYTYLIYSLPLWFLFIIYYKDKIDIKKIILFSLIIFILIPGPFFLKNLLHYGDPITPFFEFLKNNPNNDLINFASNIRHGSVNGKIFNFYEFLVIPIIHTLPKSFGGVTLLLSPIVLVCYFIFLKEKNKILIYFFIFVYILLFFSEKTSSRFFLDLYFLGVLLFLNNLDYYENKIYYKYITLSLLPYSILGIGMILYSISTLSFSILDNKNFKKIMNQKSYNYETIQWINSKTSNNDIVMFDKSSSSIRSKAYQKNKIYFYKMANKSSSELRKIIKDNGISKIIMGVNAYKKTYEQFYRCKNIDTHQPKHSSRNPINSGKSMGIIYLIDVKCAILSYQIIDEYYFKSKR